MSKGIIESKDDKNTDINKKYKRQPKKLINIIFSQKTTIILLLAFQLLIILASLVGLSVAFNYLQVLFSALGLILALLILNSRENPAYKLSWIIPLLAVPVFSVGLYLILKNQYSTKITKQIYNEKFISTRSFLKSSKVLEAKIKQEDKELYKLSQYANNYAGYPIHENSRVTYFKIGEEKFAKLLEELNKAEKFIFMEYFIIDKGEMWSAIEEILVRKAAEGVDVRLIYDGMGTQFNLPFSYKKKLNSKGIKCKIFNPFRPMLSTIQNNRDHRKITVIDGNVAFNGGINLADEYINRRERFGHWKDTAVMVEGEAVWNFTMMFLQMWEVISRDHDNYDLYRPDKSKCDFNDGYVIAYGDSPLDGENVGEYIYTDIINNAKDYLYITTPYLIPDNEMVSALGYAAKCGVDVRIIVPHIPDKWYVHYITKSYCMDLIEMGVKIYEYKPGFIHAKNFISDDNTAVVGTINLDYRSLYLHFECATYMRNCSCIKDIKRDMLDMFENDCIEITRDTRNIFSKFITIILRAFAPLL